MYIYLMSTRIVTLMKDLIVMKKIPYSVLTAGVDVYQSPGPLIINPVVKFKVTSEYDHKVLQGPRINLGLL